MMNRITGALAFTLMAWSSMTMAMAEEGLLYLQETWAVDNYELQGNDQEKAFEALIKKADELVSAQPGDASLYIWRGIIQSSFAGVKGGLGALKYAKAAKADLEQALKLDDQALQGSAYTSLGTLYFKVPGWPIGFGDGDKAEELLSKALTINPEGIDPNYFYGDFLKEEKRYTEARECLQKALAAPGRPGRELADHYRRAEVEAMLAEVENKLK